MIISYRKNNKQDCYFRNAANQKVRSFCYLYALQQLTCRCSKIKKKNNNNKINGKYRPS